MKIEKAIFACGCFWGVQHQMERAKGVVGSTVGYTGGKEQHPTYQEVKAHSTGHAEAVLVEYDAEQTTYKELCKLFFEIHDPAQTDGQGPDIGPQYRSEIFYYCCPIKILRSYKIRADFICEVSPFSLDFSRQTIKSNHGQKYTF